MNLYMQLRLIVTIQSTFLQFIAFAINNYKCIYFSDASIKINIFTIQAYNPFSPIIGREELVGIGIKYSTVAVIVKASMFVKILPIFIRGFNKGYKKFWIHYNFK